MKVTRLNKSYCPACKSCLDAATATALDEAATPESLDITICAFCGEILQFISSPEGLDLKTLSKEDFLNLPFEVTAQIEFAQIQIRGRRNDH